jgi:hypothetical protein
MQPQLGQHFACPESEVPDDVVTVDGRRIGSGRGGISSNQQRNCDDDASDVHRATG